MIHVPSPIPEPAAFDIQCRQAGIKWLSEHLNKHQELPKRPRDLWSPFRWDLRHGFHNRCGHYAMFMHDGQMDHSMSWDSCKPHQTHLAYEWTNLRFIDGSLNSRKKTLDDNLLDPFEVQDHWFEIELPSLLLKTTHVPQEYQTKAALTLEKLDLEQGLRALELRWEWYEQHRIHTENPAEGITLASLDRYAPLVARAVAKWHSDGKGKLPLIQRPVKDPFANLS